MAECKIFELNYSNELIKHYNNLAELPGFVLLESADQGIGRYDILSAFPYDYFRISTGQDCRAEIYNELQHLIPQQTSNVDLPFQGGAIGYFSYDFAARLAGIDSPAQPSLQDLPLVEMGLYDWAIISDHHLKKVHLFAANTQPNTSELVAEVLQLWQSANYRVKPFNLKEGFKSLIAKTEYQQAFYKILNELQRGRSYQVNYSQPFNAGYQGDPWAMYRRVRTNNPVPFSAFLRSATADILSFSPERFLMMDKRLLLTSPIKGTEKRSANPIEDANLRQSLLDSPKNRAENVMIVDLLRNDLGKISKTGSVQVKALCQVESYQEVHHLVSYIAGICRDDVSAMDAFQACFPGGSITGAPKLESMRIIAEQEAYARGVYCGSIGYFSSHGRFDSNIAIRTVVAREEILHMAAGGGIVIDSKCEEEYLECFTKIAAIVNGLNTYD
ncbi:Para-aminobenzoate synthase component 1 [Legionella massiliensis]|uniref:aminodeoxychorismate synthase n=1 Tax=Legionella massiliensis TaxID=1034943 RepID=A0A078KV09_9GAMM|nr:aminodeoxychorismate synthase component I [Legionella massiliensis]CDZ78275.1 Para-aminobenzoate synthase component 1 [Legionella massiliensis]CEE14013.1 Aminodeoxychorismate synthase component 1 [Legionella massiliensis]